MDQSGYTDWKSLRVETVANTDPDAISQPGRSKVSSIGYERWMSVALARVLITGYLMRTVPGEVKSPESVLQARSDLMLPTCDTTTRVCMTCEPRKTIFTWKDGDNSRRVEVGHSAKWADDRTTAGNSR